MHKKDKMKTIIQINGKDVEITLTAEQVAQINKQKQLDASTCSLQDCINYLGEVDQEVINLRQLQKISISDRILAEQEAVCMVRALNEKHIFDWNSSNEYKYRILWYLDGEFRFDCVVWDVSYSFVPASLYFKKESIAEKLGKNNNHYKNICKRFMYQ